MSYRPFWVNIRNTVYNFVSSVFRTQAQIDTIIATGLETYGTFVPSGGALPPLAKSRPRLFYDPQDAIKYVTDAGIPANYVYFVAYPAGGSSGDTYYRVYIEEE